MSIIDQEWTDAYILNYTVTSNATGNDDPNLTIQAPFLVSYLPLPQILIRVNALEEIIRRKESSGDAVATVVKLLHSAFGVEEEQAEAMVSFIQVPPKTYSDPVAIRVGKDHALIRPGRTVHVWCRVSPNFDTLDPLVLYELAEGSTALGQLSVGEGLLEINNAQRPYVKVPISNHSKHKVTVPKRTSLGTIQHVVKVLETDAPELRHSDSSQRESGR